MQRLWDRDEFLSDYGIRSLSKAHDARPFQFDGRGVGYEPAEAVTKIKGGNSNWRGPIWFPIAFLLIESLRKLGTGLRPACGYRDSDRARAVTFRRHGAQASPTA